MDYSTIIFLWFIVFRAVWLSILIYRKRRVEDILIRVGKLGRCSPLLNYSLFASTVLCGLFNAIAFYFIPAVFVTWLRMPDRGPWGEFDLLSGATDILGGVNQVPQLLMLYGADIADRMLLLYATLFAISKLSQPPHDAAL